MINILHPKLKASGTLHINDMPVFNTIFNYNNDSNIWEEYSIMLNENL